MLFVLQTGHKLGGSSPEFPGAEQNVLPLLLEPFVRQSLSSGLRCWWLHRPGRASVANKSAKYTQKPPFFLAESMAFWELH